MTNEYIKFYHPEKVYGEKNLLLAQADLISMNKRIKAYKKLRKQELLLRIELRKAMSEMKESLELLNKRLPSSDLCKPEATQPIKIIKKKQAPLPPMDQELEDIRQKLSSLHE